MKHKLKLGIVLGLAFLSCETTPDTIASNALAEPEAHHLNDTITNRVEVEAEVALADTVAVIDTLQVQDSILKALNEAIIAHQSQLDFKDDGQCILPDSLKLQEMNTAFESYYFPEIYWYLVNNYKIETEIDSVEFVSYYFSEICSFQQRFEGGIQFNFECIEEVGASYACVFSKADLDCIKSIIEVLGAGMDNVWVSDLDYEPSDGGAGCYYNLEIEGDDIKLSNYCGC